jgi:hypothetical protein
MRNPRRVRVHEPLWRPDYLQLMLQSRAWICRNSLARRWAGRTDLARTKKHMPVCLHCTRCCLRWSQMNGSLNSELPHLQAPWYSLHRRPGRHCRCWPGSSSSRLSLRNAEVDKLSLRSNTLRESPFHLFHKSDWSGLKHKQDLDRRKTESGMDRIDLLAVVRSPAVPSTPS